jgi:hypothetical protein
MRATLAMIVGATVSAIGVSLLKEAYAILPSDAATVWLATCVGRGRGGEGVPRVERQRLGKNSFLRRGGRTTSPIVGGLAKNILPQR